MTFWVSDDVLIKPEFKGRTEWIRQALVWGFPVVCRTPLPVYIIMQQSYSLFIYIHIVMI